MRALARRENRLAPCRQFLLLATRRFSPIDGIVARSRSPTGCSRDGAAPSLEARLQTPFLRPFARQTPGLDISPGSLDFRPDMLVDDYVSATVMAVFSDGSTPNSACW